MPTGTLLRRPDTEIRLEPPSRSGGLPLFLGGDIVLFAARDDWYGRTSRWLLRSRGEGPTYAVHTAQFLDSGHYLELAVVGKIRATNEILKPRQALDMWQRRGFEVWRYRTLSAAQRAAVAQKAVTYVGERFGWGMFTTHLLDGLLVKALGREVFFFRRLNHNTRYPICSWITAYAYDRALHYQFGVPPECADPDQIADWVSGHPDEWERVFRLDSYA